MFVPLAAISWPGLFNPHYIDLPFMAAHGVLGYVVSWQFANVNNNLNNFFAAMAVTFSSGVISSGALPRFAANSTPLLIACRPPNLNNIRINRSTFMRSILVFEEFVLRLVFFCYVVRRRATVQKAGGSEFFQARQVRDIAARLST